MHLHYWRISLIYLVSFLFLIALSVFSPQEGDFRLRWPSALAKQKKTGPPPHAKAHGYRAKYTYRFYPSAMVYYDVSRRAYFYLEGTTWRVSVSLPSGLRVQLGDFVTIEMDSDKPYLKFKEHKRKYLPGHLKKR